MKINFFKALMLVNSVSNELTKIVITGKPNLPQSLDSISNLLAASGCPFTENQTLIVNIAKEIIIKLETLDINKEITADKVLLFAMQICDKYGIPYNKNSFINAINASKV